jgi:hypothetical protein
MEVGARSVDDQDRCLYAGTPWQTEVVTKRQDLDTLKEVAHTTRSLLLVRAIANLLRFLLCVLESRKV